MIYEYIYILDLCYIKVKCEFLSDMCNRHPWQYKCIFSIYQLYGRQEYSSSHGCQTGTCTYKYWTGGQKC